MCDKSSPTACDEPVSKRRKIAPFNMTFSSEHVQNYLFGKAKSIAVDGSCSLVNSSEVPSFHEDLPHIVRFCISTVPGAGYGVQASEIIPEGAWIGPYKGELVTPEYCIDALDSSYLWEIFKDGELKAYIDGRDQRNSSWMRFIGCARHKEEQNLYAFQYREKIYYRAFKTINPGQELLVWYDDIYTQYLGIPCQGIYDMASSKGPTKFPGNLVVVAEEESLPATPPTSPRRSPNDSPTEPSAVRDRLCRRSSYGFSNASTIPVFSRTPALSTKGNISKLEVKTSEVNTTVSQEITRLSVADEPNNTLNTFNESKKDTTSKCQTGQSVEENQLNPTAVRISSSPTEEQPLTIQCGQCKKLFTQRSMLHTHICSNITSQPYQCGHCDERFSSPGEMTIHVAIHQDKKPFKCGYCSRSFTGATTLNNHVRMHTGEKPFDCYRCGKTFTKGLQLSKHQKDPRNCVPCMKYMHNSSIVSADPLTNEQLNRV